MDKRELKKQITSVLKEQGLVMNSKNQSILNNKDVYREVQQYSRAEQIYIHRNFILENISTVKSQFIDYRKFDPFKISLELREVKPRSKEEILYRWWNLMWWSIPYQRAYGRQVRFIIWDKGNDAPFGLIGLQSPILKIAVRDKYLRLTSDNIDVWVNRSMQAHRLGALPPYNFLIGGKMAAMALTCNELKDYYYDKYKDTETEILGRRIDPNLLFYTTSSAFGNSSIYNRLKYYQDQIAFSLGYTKGFGSFHIPEGLYKEIQGLLIRNGIDVSTSFGSGPSRKIKLFGMAFRILGLPDLSYHNLKREYFLFPLVSNLNGVIHNNETPNYYNRPLDSLTEYWKHRWCLPRAERIEDWRRFDFEAFLTQSKEEVLRYNWNGRRN